MHRKMHGLPLPDVRKRAFRRARMPDSTVSCSDTPPCPIPGPDRNVRPAPDTETDLRPATLSRAGAAGP